MSSSAHRIDSEQKTLVETMKAILRLSDNSVTDHNHILRYGAYHTKVIPLALALLDYGHNPESLSRNLWMHLLNDVDNIEELSQFLAPAGGSFQSVSRSFARVANLQGASPIRPLTWQSVAIRFQQSVKLMKALLEWTLTFFRDLLIPIMAKGRTPTPASVVSTASRNQKGLKKKLIERDGWFSPVGYVMDFDAPAHITPLPAGGTAVLEAAHIIPFSASKNLALRRKIAIFTGQDMESLLAGDNINDPSNALLLSPTTHEYFGNFRFSLECRNKKYFIRRLVEARLLPTELLNHADGDEILFGHECQEIAKPSSLLCNVHLAVGLVLRNSGVAEMIGKILQDEDDFDDGNADGDHWFQVSASYLDRKLRALQDFDGLNMDETDDTMDADTDGNLSVSGTYAMRIGAGNSYRQCMAA
ncbi:uncharacterized protein V1513DRAFT_142957 [Lipomyces chichibuensis]|uniref:uncharacterized protein n=1 Tax=Lipomyces chichibuensis TaxID=1546026 RepID=UPI003343F6D5